MSSGDANKRVRGFYTRLLENDLSTDLLVVDETLYISRSKFRVPFDLTFKFLRTNILPYTDVISIEGSDIDHFESYLSRYHVSPSDAVHLAVMEKEGATRIASEDEEFDKVKEVKRIWLETPGFEVNQSENESEAGG